MVRTFQLYAISYQPYAKFARLASEIFLSSLQSEFFSNLLGHKSRMSLPFLTDASGKSCRIYSMENTVQSWGFRLG